MRHSHSKPNPLIITGMVIVSLFLSVKWISWSFDRRIDLGNKPVSQVFHEVFLCPIPAGSSHFKVAGMSSLAGDVWMQFQVQDVHKFLVSMKSNPLMSITLGDSPLSDGFPSRSEADSDHYSHDVGWDDVYQVKQPECYMYESVPPGHGWFGPIIVDRQQKTIYVHGGLM